MALSFDFPGWQVSLGPQGDKTKHLLPTPLSTWAADLDELSGDEDEAPQHQEEHSDSPAAASPAQKRQRTADAASQSSQQHDPPAAAAAADASLGHAACWGVMPDTVLLLLVSRLGLTDVAAASGVCRSWHATITAADGIWHEQTNQLFGAGWPWPPFVGGRLTSLPASLAGPTGARRQLRAALATNRVSLRFCVMRKGYDFLVAGFEALWASLAAHQPQQSQQQPQQLDDRFSGRHLQRLVQKLSDHSWQLMYEGFAAALTARTDHIQQQLLTGWQQQQRQAALAAALLPPGGHQSRLPSPPEAAAAAAAGACDVAAAAAAATTAALADCAGGILPAVEASAGGEFSGELLAADPELLLAASHRGSRPAAAIDLWRALLADWAVFDRWLAGVVSRAAPLGARVAGARAMQEPVACSSAPPAAIPHLRNKGLLLFRSQVLLSYGLRRPLQQAALWLSAAAAAAAANPGTWQGAASSSGGGSGSSSSSRVAEWMSESDFEVLQAARKLLRELDVADDGSESPAAHTHAKFRRCFGALLTRERRNRSCVLR